MILLLQEIEKATRKVLKILGKKYGFSVDIVNAIKLVIVRISSTYSKRFNICMVE